MFSKFYLKFFLFLNPAFVVKCKICLTMISIWTVDFDLSEIKSYLTSFCVRSPNFSMTSLPRMIGRNSLKVMC